MPDFGVTIDEHLANIYLSALIVAGVVGPSIEKSQRKTDLIEDELIGRIGPIVTVYDAELNNRIAGEWE